MFFVFFKNATKINSRVSFYFLKWFKWPVIYSFVFPCGLEHSWHSLMFLPPKEAPWKGRGSKAQAFLPLPAMLLIISLFYHGLNHKIMASPGVTMSVGCRKIKDIDAELSEQTWNIFPFLLTSCRAVITVYYIHFKIWRCIIHLSLTRQWSDFWLV